MCIDFTNKRTPLRSTQSCDHRKNSFNACKLSSSEICIIDSSVQGQSLTASYAPRAAWYLPISRAPCAAIFKWVLVKIYFISLSICQGRQCLFVYMDCTPLYKVLCDWRRLYTNYGYTAKRNGAILFNIHLKWLARRKKLTLRP